MTPEQDLKNATDELERAYQVAKADLESRHNCSVFLVQDTNGRYLLLDTLTALVTAKAALLRSERE